MDLKPAIEEYLRITCQLIIDEFNETYKYLDSKEQLRVIANEEFSQIDIYRRVADTFKNKTHCKPNGINIKHKNFIINVHYLKNFKSDNGTPSSSKNWSQPENKFNWLENEIKKGNKGKCAFVIGWFNAVERFSQLMQLGGTPGGKPKIDTYKIAFFPFLKTLGTTYTQDLTYNYSKAYKPLQVELVENINDEYNCLFLGNESDKFHFAIYY